MLVDTKKIRNRNEREKERIYEAPTNLDEAQLQCVATKRMNKPIEIKMKEKPSFEVHVSSNESSNHR